VFSPQLTFDIVENLRLYMGNDGCKHIFFAAAGAPRYLDALRQHHRKSAQKLTIVTGFDTGHDIRELGLPVVAFPKVFAERSAATFKFIDFNNAQVGCSDYCSKHCLQSHRHPVFSRLLPRSISPLLLCPTNTTTIQLFLHSSSYRCIPSKIECPSTKPSSGSTFKHCYPPPRTS